MSDSVFLLILLCGVIAGLKLVAEAWLKGKKREQRRRFYRVEYLKSDGLEAKAMGSAKTRWPSLCLLWWRASQVHHKRYARWNIGREPIEWLVSTGDSCHRKQHGR
jgi:hypothetical protein